VGLPVWGCPTPRKGAVHPLIGRRDVLLKPRNANGRARGPARSKNSESESAYQLPVLGHAPVLVVVQVREDTPVEPFLVMVNLLPEAELPTTV
jgi:hypothetical protein